MIPASSSIFCRRWRRGRRQRHRLAQLDRGRASVRLQVLQDRDVDSVELHAASPIRAVAAQHFGESCQSAARAPPTMAAFPATPKPTFHEHGGTTAAHGRGRSRMDIGLARTATSLESRFVDLDQPVLLTGIQALVRLLLEQSRLRSRRRAAHRRLRVRLSRLPARRAGPRTVAPQETAGRARHPLRAGRQRRPRRDHADGHAAARRVSRRARRWRVRAVVRQGAGRRSLRRRAALRQHGGHASRTAACWRFRATTTARIPRPIRTRPSSCSRTCSCRC